MFDKVEDVGYFIDQQIKSYTEKYPSSKEHITQFIRKIQYELEQLVREKLSLEGYFYNRTGESPMDVLFGLGILQDDYLLDDIDDDNYTVPLIQQIKSRLDTLEVEQEENEQLKNKLKRKENALRNYQVVLDKLKEIEAERDYYKHEYEIRIK